MLFFSLFGWRTHSGVVGGPFELAKALFGPRIHVRLEGDTAVVLNIGCAGVICCACCLPRDMMVHRGILSQFPPFAPGDAVVTSKWA